MANEDTNQQKTGKGYGKRPWWFWVLLYVVIGGIVYAGIYYVYAMSHSSSNQGGSTSTQNSIY